MSKRKKIIFNLLLVVWLMFSLWVTILILNNYGEAIGALFPAYLLASSAIILAGRFIIEFIIVFFFWS